MKNVLKIKLNEFKELSHLSGELKMHVEESKVVAKRIALELESEFVRLQWLLQKKEFKNNADHYHKIFKQLVVLDKILDRVDGYYIKFNYIGSECSKNWFSYDEDSIFDDADPHKSCEDAIQDLASNYMSLLKRAGIDCKAGGTSLFYLTMWEDLIRRGA